VPTPREHIVTCCSDCVAEHQGMCLLADEALTECEPGFGKSSPEWCPLRKWPVVLKIKPDEETD